jgi:hypothetical protein
LVIAMSGERQLRMNVGDYAEKTTDAPLRLRHGMLIVTKVTEATRIAIEAATKPLITRIGELETQVKELEARPSLEYQGVWAANRQYARGACVSFRGSLWIAQQSTSEKPSFDGSAPTWRLAVKQGRPGRPA